MWSLCHKIKSPDLDKNNFESFCLKTIHRTSISNNIEKYISYHKTPRNTECQTPSSLICKYHKKYSCRGLLNNSIFLWLRDPWRNHPLRGKKQTLGLAHFGFQGRKTSPTIIRNHAFPCHGFQVYLPELKTPSLNNWHINELMDSYPWAV